MMKLADVLKTMNGNENTTVLGADGKVLYDGTAKNTPEEVAAHEVVKIQLLPLTYLGIRFIVE